MLSFEQFVERSIDAGTDSELFALYQSVLKDYGFDRVVYTLITDHPSIKKPARHGILGNYPEDWMSHYIAKDFEKIDPVIKTTSVTKSPFIWEEMMETGEWSREQRHLMAEGSEAGLRDGAAIPIFGGIGEVAGVGLASSAGGVDINKKILHVIRAITTQFHFRYCEMEKERIANISGAEAAKEIRISSREREVLHWTADGKSDSVIAGILGISQDAVKYHRKNVYRKLEVSERTMAVLKAMRLGLINPYCLR